MGLEEDKADQSTLRVLTRAPGGQRSDL